MAGLQGILENHEVDKGITDHEIEVIIYYIIIFTFNKG